MFLAETLPGVLYAASLLVLGALVPGGLDLLVEHLIPDLVAAFWYPILASHRIYFVGRLLASWELLPLRAQDIGGDDVASRGPLNVRWGTGPSGAYR